VEMINTVMSHLGTAAIDLLTDRNKMAMAVSVAARGHPPPPTLGSGVEDKWASCNHSMIEG
jgi:hypothetical protein